MLNIFSLTKLKDDIHSSPVQQQVPCSLLYVSSLRGGWTFDQHVLSAGCWDKTKRLLAVLQRWQSSSPFPLHSLKIWNPSLFFHISLWLDTKWAHIINISILFDCPPNKSHCSNKQRALLHCLPLSGFELLTLRLTIYYRHLSQVTDKHCDGCMILLCQNGFISPLQATISTKLMSCAYSLSSDFLSFPLPLFSSLRWQPLWVLSSKGPTSPGTNVFYYLLI